MFNRHLKACSSSACPPSDVPCHFLLWLRATVEVTSPSQMSLLIDITGSVCS